MSGNRVIERPPTQERTSIRRHAAWAGIAGPPLFATGLAVITWASWKYLRDLGFVITDHGESAWPSSLARGPVGWAQILNFAVFGLLLLLFFTGLRNEFPRRRSGRVAGFCLTASAVGWLLVAFPEDGPPFGEPSTWAGYLHGLGFLCLVLFTMTGMVATSIALRGSDAWRGHALISAVAAAATFVFLFVLVFALEVATTLGIYGFFAVILAWVETLALRLRAVQRGRLVLDR